MRTPAHYTVENLYPDGRDVWVSPHPFGPKGLGFMRKKGVWTVYRDRKVVLVTEDTQSALDLVNRQIAEWVAQ